MATLYTDNYAAAYNSEPFTAQDNDVNGGLPHRLYAEYTLAAEFGASDVLKMFKLPAGARIVKARVVIPAATAGAVTVGWSAGENGLESATAAGIFASQTITSAIDANMSWAVSGHNKEFSETVDIQFVGGTLTDGSIGDVWKLEVEFVNS